MNKKIISMAISLILLSLTTLVNAAPKHTEMIIIPAGEFEMGCKDSDGVYCLPGTTPHKVHLDEYKIDKYLITFERYQACIDNGSCTEPYMGSACNYGMSWSADHPANCITFKQAEQACQFEGKRLPTEAEWTKAARGTKGNLFPWGNTPDPSCDLVVWNQKVDGRLGPGCGAGTSQPVGSKPKGASPYGLMDTAGNLFEWTSDWYSEEYFRQSPKKNPKGPKSGEFKVLRSSAWSARHRDGVALTVRAPYAPLGQGYVVGARCAQN